MSASDALAVLEEGALWALEGRPGHFAQTLEQLAAGTGLGYDTAKRCVAVLTEAGWLEEVTRGTYGGRSAPARASVRRIVLERAESRGQMRRRDSSKVSGPDAAPRLAKVSGPNGQSLGATRGPAHHGSYGTVHRAGFREPRGAEVEPFVPEEVTPASAEVVREALARCRPGRPRGARAPEEAPAVRAGPFSHLMGLDPADDGADLSHPEPTRAGR